MQIVIKLREEEYDEILNGIENAEIAGVGLSELSIALKNGIPLPKGHGALKDADKLAVSIAMIRDKCNYYGNEYEQALFQAYDNSVDEIIDAPTIIDADKEVEE